MRPFSFLFGRATSRFTVRFPASLSVQPNSGEHPARLLLCFPRLRGECYRKSTASGLRAGRDDFHVVPLLFSNGDDVEVVPTNRWGAEVTERGKFNYGWTWIPRGEG